ncbi:MAG: alpha/beta hydrolase [Acidimicrobiales bacterium]
MALRRERRARRTWPAVVARSRLTWPAVVAIVVVATVGAGCSASGSAASPRPAGPIATPSPAPLAAPPPLTWSPCASTAGIQCGTVAVPIDYRHPSDGSINLAVTRAPALDGFDRDGTLLFNPGGPGESGNQILPVLLDFFPAAVRQEYNIVTFDPRGTGASDPLRCGTSPSKATSVDPVPAAAGRPLPGTSVFTAMARSCAAKEPSLTPSVDTVDTARDMDRIRQALGLPRISFYGLSYGTSLGTVYADLFPHRLAAMVLDGAVDVNASLTQQADEQAPAAEQSLDHLFSTCTPSSECPLGRNPRGYFRNLAASLTRHPLPAPGHGDDVPVTVGDLDTATLFDLSVPGFTPSYESALVAARNGNGAALRSLALQFATDIDGAPLVDPSWAITCNDAAAHPGPVAAGTLARAMNARYPLIGAYTVTYTMGGCVGWPPARQAVADVHPRGTPPVLIIGNTGDPNTPLIGARHLAAAFPTASLAIWRGWGHTWLLSGSSDGCMQHVVTSYLIDGELPASGTRCS